MGVIRLPFKKHGERREQGPGVRVWARALSPSAGVWPVKLSPSPGTFPPRAYLAEDNWRRFKFLGRPRVLRLQPLLSKPFTH